METVRSLHGYNDFVLSSEPEYTQERVFSAMARASEMNVVYWGLENNIVLDLEPLSIDAYSSINSSV